MNRRRFLWSGLILFEQPQRQFDPQNTANRFIQPFFRDSAFLHQLLGIQIIDTGIHVDFGTIIDADPHGVLIVRRHAVGYSLLNRFPIGNHRPLKAQISTKDFFQQMITQRCRLPRYIIERTHHRTGAGLHSRSERRQINLAQRMFGNFRIIVVPSALGGTVTYVMFRTGGHMRAVLPIIALETANPGGRHQTAVIRVLTRPLCHTPPTGIPGNIYHRRENHVDSIR